METTVVLERKEGKEKTLMAKSERVGWLYVLFCIRELFHIHINIRVRRCAHLAIRAHTYVRIKKKRSLNMTYDVLDSFSFVF